jgi:hypothetical protein
MYSGGTRESAQESTIANGCWALARASRVGAPSGTAADAFFTNRSLPDLRRIRPAPLAGSCAVGVWADSNSAVTTTTCRARRSGSARGFTM